MPKPVYILLICLLLALAGGPALAQPPEGEYGAVRGRVMDAAGQPVGAGIPVRVVVGPTTVDLETGADGRFVTPMPAGTGSVTVLNQGAQAFMVRAGEAVDVEVRLATGGVLVRARYDDGTDAATLLTTEAACRTIEGWQAAAIPAPLRPGWYWAGSVPAWAREYAIVGRLAELRGGHMFRQAWPLAPDTAVRVVSLTVPRPRPARLALRDLAGAPVTGTICTVRLAYTPEVPSARDEAPKPGAPVREKLQLVSDPTGTLDLGRLAPRSYTLTVQADTRVGKPMPFTVDAAGHASLAEYVLGDGLRDVTHTVRRADGTPAANTRVWATYQLGAQVMLRDEITDAQGRIVWKDLPPVSVTVWGDDVPAGVIDETATTVDGALRPPKPGPPVTVRLVGDNLGPQAGRVLWYTRTDPAAAPQLYETMYTHGLPTVMPVRWNTGASLEVSALLAATPPRMAALGRLYLPEAEGVVGAQAEMRVSFSPCPTVRLRFVGPTGVPLPPPSGVRVVESVITGRLPGILPESALKALPSAAAVGMQPDGTVTVTLPAEGTITRLAADLDLTFADIPVDSRHPEHTIVLPEPLFTVPAGTEVSWVTRNRPDDVQVLTARAWDAETSIYGRRDPLLAAWAIPAPNMLVVWNYLKAQPREVHRLRTVFIEPRIEGAASYQRTLVAPSPLPAPRATTPAVPGVTLRPGESRLVGPLELWTGDYWCADEGLPFYAAPVRVPEDGPVLLTWTMPPPVAAPPQQRRIALAFALDDLTRRRTGASPGLTVVFDGPRAETVSLNVAALLANPTVSVSVPPAARSLTVRWIGAGVATGIAIPPAVEGQVATVQVTGWRPGVAVAGTVTRADGTPLAGAQLALMPSGGTPGEALRGGSVASGEVLRGATDAAGAFQFADLSPGTFVLTTALETGQRLDWLVAVPAGGTTVALAESRTATRLLGEAGWWIPDGGAPIWLGPAAFQAPLDNLPAGPGWYWSHGGSGGIVGAALATQARRVASPADVREGAAGPPLGLLLPLKTGLGQPLAVTLIGRGDRAGLRMTMRGITPKPASFLGLQVARIASVPPGEYEVTVEYATTVLNTTVMVSEAGGCARFVE